MRESLAELQEMLGQKLHSSVDPSMNCEIIEGFLFENDGVV